VTLPAGGSAVSQLTDFSTCNSPESDIIRIYPPNQTASVEAPMQLRGCKLVVTPVAAG
jgi:hypothetical protein